MCGSTIYVNTSVQQITSPSYPDNYQNNRNCEWILETQTQQTHIRIDFVAFNTEENFDFLNVSKT